MGDINVAPVLFEILRHQSPVTVVRLILAAEQAALGNRLLRYRFLDAPLLHQVEKAKLVGLPVGTLLPVLVEHLLGGRQCRNMNIVHPTDLSEEVSEIIPLRKAS